MNVKLGKLIFYFCILFNLVIRIMRCNAFLDVCKLTSIIIGGAQHDVKWLATARLTANLIGRGMFAKS